MKPTIKFIQGKVLLILALIISMSMSAQEMSSFESAKKEIVETFGTMPTMFKVYPKNALAGAWEDFKQLQSPEGKIPPKYRELIELAVASQIPCQYCIFYHNAAARHFGATDEEVQEAIAHGANTRHWSTILQGNQVDLEMFKEEFSQMMKFMDEKNQKMD